MKKKRRMFNRLIFIFSIMIMVFSSSLTVFAGTSSSNGSSNGSSGSGDLYYKVGTSYSSGFRWVYFTGNKTVSSPAPHCDARVEMNGTHGAHIEKNDYKHGWYFFTWDWYFSWAHAPTPGALTRVLPGDKYPYYVDPWNNIVDPNQPGGNKGNTYKVGCKGKLTNQELVEEAKRNNFSFNDWDLMYRQSGTNQGLEAVWIAGWQKSDSDSKETIVKIKSDDEVTLDRTSESAEDLYNNPTTEGEYYGKSLPTEMNHKKVITVTTQTVTKKDTYMTNGTDNWNHNISYSKGGTNTITRTIKYTVKVPTIEKTMFRPFDLNKNGVADENEVKQTYNDYQNGSPELKMSVDNKQNIIDGKAIQTLDTNTSTSFNVTFNNDQFGIPKKSEGGFDLLDESPGKDYKLDDGTYSKDVINNYNNLGSTNTGLFQSDNMSDINVEGLQTDYIYWGGSLNADISSSNASLIFDNQENKGGNQFTFGKEFGGGDFTFKTIKIGDYKLVNGEIPWWEAQYEQGRFYTYGVEYKGIIKIDGIYDPTIVDQGMYAKLYSNVNTQPILKGLFKAKTVGGNIG